MFMRLWTTILATALAALLVGCGDESEPDDHINPPPNQPDEIDLVVDANRDGVADLDNADDQGHAFEWSNAFGACFLPNIDDDDANHLSDADDVFVNGDADALDLARVKVRAWPQAPAS